MRQSVLVVMHTDSRFVMVFWGMKKGDGETLLRLFFERLANHLFWLSQDTGALDESGSETMFNPLMAAHSAFRFHASSNRSVQTNINEVVQCCRNSVADFQTVPAVPGQRNRTPYVMLKRSLTESDCLSIQMFLIKITPEQ